MADLEHWDNRYQTGETPWDTGRPSSELQRVVAAEKIQPCRAVELGCGTGVNAVWLAEQGFEVTAIDLSPSALATARQRAEKAGVNVRFVAGDVLHPPEDFGGPYAFFFDRGCYHVVRRESPELYLQTLLRLTAPGSLGLVLAGNAKETHQPGPPVVTEEELRRELGQAFTILWLKEIRFDSPEGMNFEPLGWSCLLQR